MLKLPVDLIRIANNNKIEVYYKKLPNGISGAIRYDNDKKRFQILIANDEPQNRQRFTLAHELAHFFLEKDKLETMQEIHFDTLYRKNINSNEEKVGYLAGALLMDSAIIKKMYKICNVINLRD